MAVPRFLLLALVIILPGCASSPTQHEPREAPVDPRLREAVSVRVWARG